MNQIILFAIGMLFGVLAWELGRSFYMLFRDKGGIDEV